MTYTHISYTGAGVDWHESEAKAIEMLEEAISDARSDAIQSGEWCEEIERWFVAKISHRVEADDMGEDGTDYFVEAVT